MQTIANTIHSIDIEKYNSIEKEREAVMGDTKFIEWCKQYNIGSRVEVKDTNALDIMTQYISYPQWVSKNY